MMKGGGGADTFVFGTGEDRIKDFADDTDTIAINADLARGMNVSDVLGDAHVVNGDAVLDFGGGHMLIVEDVSNLDILANDLIII